MKKNRKILFRMTIFRQFRAITCFTSLILLVSLLSTLILGILTRNLRIYVARLEESHKRELEQLNPPQPQPQPHHQPPDPGCPVYPCTYHLEPDINLADFIRVMNRDVYQRVNQRVRADKSIQLGGFFSPEVCGIQPSARVAILVPYRQRGSNLMHFLAYIHPFLQKQNIEYKIYIVSQAFDGLLFNRGALLNIGFRLAMDDWRHWECVVFHDVDLLPENPANLYQCGDQPCHLNTASSNFDYGLPYEDYFGGVVSMTPEMVRRVNGFSNTFFGWGGEDDDLWMRVNQTGYTVQRNSRLVGRYEMLDHREQARNKLRFKMLKRKAEKRQQFKEDGLNSLAYDLVKMESHALYTNITVRLNKLYAQEYKEIHS